MCGIAGFWSPRGGVADMDAVLDAMAESMAHRGPDARGRWSDSSSGLGLAHVRLSIIDLSPAGAQPMASADGRLHLSYNGEIYNYADIRRELEQGGLAPSDGWRGHSDTEVLLAAFSAWGVESTLHRCVGMFALALWDRERRELTLARDRMGIKPLYYGLAGPSLVFGSQPSPLKRHPHWDNPVDRDALCLYLRHLYVPAPHSIHQDVFQLEPGRMVVVSARDVESRTLPAPRTWWSLSEAARRGRDAPFAGTPDQAVDELERLLSLAVAGRMISDVPLGAFLSGGVDSSTVVALMQEASSRPVRTFTIGYLESDYDEAAQAAAVAAHLGTDHTELRVTPEQAMEVVPLLPRFYDEPFADASQIPTFLVSRMARKHVTVSLSGDGGDELFMGYNRHLAGPRMWRRLGLAPRPLRSMLASLMDAGLSRAAAVAMELRQRSLPPEKRQHIIFDKLQKLAAAMPAKGREDFYHRICSWWTNPEEVVVNGRPPATRFTDRGMWPPAENFAAFMSAMDMRTYLPGDILTKTDRASMAVALEARVPIIDHRVVEFALGLPASLKLGDGQGKDVLRRVLYRRAPRKLIERPKQGFGVPIDQWLRGPLTDWAESLLAPERLKNEGYFRPGPVRKAWDDHRSGRRNRQYHLWGILMFQAWLEEHRP